MTKKIADLETGIARGLEEARGRKDLPLGLQDLVEFGKDHLLDVRLLDSRDRKLNRRGDADKRRRDVAAVTIYFRPGNGQSEKSDGEVPPREPSERLPEPRQVNQTASPHEAAPADRGAAASLTADILGALDAAERRPGYTFVSLKWFRDTVLPAVGAELNADPARRQTVLRELTEKRLLLTSKVPNPKNPAFPVTAIRINREYPDVAALLSAGRRAVDLGFAPVEIRGEPLSATILRERR